MTKCRSLAWRVNYPTRSARVAAGRVMLVDETQPRRRVGLLDEEVGVSRLYTPALLADMVQVDVRTIHRWQRRGYLLPACEVRKLPYFDFSEVRVARRLAELVHAGVSLAAIDRQMTELARLAPDVDRPLADLSIVVEGGKIFLRRGHDLAEPSGQLLIDFDAPDETDTPPEIANPGGGSVPPTTDELRSTAVDLADEGEPQQASPSTAACCWQARPARTITSRSPICCTKWATSRRPANGTSWPSSWTKTTTKPA